MELKLNLAKANQFTFMSFKISFFIQEEFNYSLQLLKISQQGLEQVLHQKRMII